MDDGEQRSLLGSLLAPLTLPGRAAKDLETIGTAARGIPAFERELIEHLEELGADVREMSVELNGAIARVLEELGRLDQRWRLCRSRFPS